MQKEQADLVISFLKAFKSDGSASLVFSCLNFWTVIHAPNRCFNHFPMGLDVAQHQGIYTKLLVLGGFCSVFIHKVSFHKCKLQNSSINSVKLDSHR